VEILMRAEVLGATPPFWQSLEIYETAPALIDARSGHTINYKDLAVLADMVVRRRRSVESGLTILAARNDLGGVAVLLGLLRARRAVLLVEAERAASDLARLVDTYRPGAVIAPADVLHAPQGADVTIIEGIGYQTFDLAQAAPIHPELGLMILTSGSTGSPRAVRLSWRNLASSAAQVQQGLALDVGDRAPLHLPIHHVYGLSVLFSHLRAGGAVLTDMPSLLDRSFWEAAGAHGVTSLPGVSFTFEILRSLGGRWQPPPTLRRLTHSGDRLSQASLDWALGLDRACFGFFRMYGMSEACSRMAILPASEFHDHAQSVGAAVTMGRFSLTDEGEIIYAGPNVMMGYAHQAEDLGRGPELQGILHTGDLGCLDAAGHLYISGRRSRIAKIMGARISLDDVEAVLERHTPVVAQASDTGLTILHEPVDKARFSAAVADLARMLRVPPKLIRLQEVTVLARNSAGKLLKVQPESCVPF
jgi:acyl-CoA synthetase (AMP-forming)/AMP-acid ligase II